MDALDVNYLNELLERDVEIREVRRPQMHTKIHAERLPSMKENQRSSIRS